MGQPAEIDEVGAGLSPELDGEAREPVADDEQARDHPAPRQRAADDRDAEKHEQQHAFEQCFIELAGMSRHAAGGGHSLLPRARKAAGGPGANEGAG